MLALKCGLGLRNIHNCHSHAVVLTQIYKLLNVITSRGCLKSQEKLLFRFIIHTNLISKSDVIARKFSACFECCVFPLKSKIDDDSLSLNKRNANGKKNQKIKTVYGWFDSMYCPRCFPNKALCYFRCCHILSNMLATRAAIDRNFELFPFSAMLSMKNI